MTDTRTPPEPSAAVTGDVGEMVQRLNSKIASNGAWMTSDLQAFYVSIRDLLTSLAERNTRLERETSFWRSQIAETLDNHLSFIRKRPEQADDALRSLIGTLELIADHAPSAALSPPTSEGD